MLGESDLLPSMLPEAGFSAFRERFGREPREISLTLEDSSGFGYWFSGVDAVPEVGTGVGASEGPFVSSVA